MKNTNRLRMGGTAAAVTAIVIAGVVLLNVLAGMLTDRFFLKLDLTATSLFEISEESAEILRDLPGQATIYLLLGELEAANDLPTYIASATGTDGLNLVALLEKYASLSGGDITLRYLDPTLNPDIREQFGVGEVSKADILIQGPNRVKHIAFAELFDVSDEGLQGYRVEQALTGAVLHVMAEFVPEVVFAEGHGMLTPDSTSSSSLGMLRSMFEQSGFSAVSVNLATNDIPDDARTVVVSCPTTDFTQDEIAKLDAFLKSGGDVLYLAGTERNANLGSWLAEWGVQMEDHFIMDETEHISNPLFVIPLINAHEMFNSVGNHSLPLLQIPRELRVLFSERGDLTVSEVLGTSQYSYGRLIGSENTELDRADDDVSGPFIVGTVSSYRSYDRDTGASSDSHLVVMPYSLCIDGVLSYYSYLNNDMTGAMVRYLTPADVSSGLVIPTKALPNPLLTLTGLPSLLTSAFLAGVLPLGIFVTGLVLWLKRRKR